MRKRILAVILSVCMIVGALPSIALAAGDYQNTSEFIDPDTPGDDILALIEGQTPAVPDNVVTPYGKTGTKTIIESSEAYFHNNSFDYYYQSGDKAAVYRHNINNALNSLHYTKAVAFDPTGSGKRNHLAVLGFKHNDAHDNGTSYLYIADVENDRIIKSYELDKDWFWWTRNLDATAANNYFAITAGDYDNDGRDSLIIYNGAMRGNDWQNALKEVKYDGSNWSSAKYISVYDLFNTDYMTGKADDGMPLRQNNVLQNKLCVSLATGDVDGDGIDDLIVLSSTSRLTDAYKNTAYRAAIPMLAIAKGKDGASSINDLAVTKTRLSTESGGKTYTVAAPSVSVGDINLDSKDELIIGGFDVTNSSGNPVEFVKEKNGKYYYHSHVRYYVCRLDGENLKICGGEALSSKDGNASTINNVLNKEEHDVWMQFSTEIVSFDGIDKTPSVFLNGLIYSISYNLNKDQYTLRPISGAPNLLNNAEYIGLGEDTYNTFIRSSATGLNYKSGAGKETLSIIVSRKVNENGDQFRFVGITYCKNSSGEWETLRSSNFQGSTAEKGSFVADIDVGNDSVIVRYRTTLCAYTDPNVIAFLQAAPYYSDLGAGNSSTTYSYSESYTEATTSGTQISAGVGITTNFETPVAQTSMETALLETVSEEFVKSFEKEYTTTLEANDKNQVVIRRTLVYLYCYDLLTGYDANGDPVFEECGLVITAPQQPVLTSLSMEQYDAFATAYNKKYGSSGTALDIISRNDGALMEKYFLNNEGNPLAYAPLANSYKNGFYMSNDGTWMGLSHSGGTSQLGFSASVGSEYTKTVSDGISVNMALTVGSSFAGFGASVGVTSSLESLKSSGITSSQVTTTATGGAVQNLSDDEYAYHFDWTLIGWKTEESDGLFFGVPFIGYAVRGASAPPPCINDLTYTLSDIPGEATLTWTAPKEDEGRAVYTDFIVYRIDNGNRIKLGTTETTTFDVSIDETKSPDTSAVYVVVTRNSTTNQVSIDSNEVLVVFSPSKSQVEKMIEEASKNLDDAFAVLSKLIESGDAANAEALQKAIADLTAAYQEADNLLKADIAALEENLAALDEKMKSADAALRSAIDAVQKNLDDAVANLTELIANGNAANAEALQKAIADLTAAYQAADALLKADITALEENLAALDEKMKSADAALQSAIDAVQKNLDDAIANLTELIANGDAANVEALQKAIADLTAAYQAADDLLKADITALEENLAALDGKMKSADAALQSAIDAVQKNLDDAVANLTELIVDGDAANAEALQKAIADLTAAYQAADDLLKADLSELSEYVTLLEAKMLQANQALQAAIETVQKNLDLAIAEQSKAAAEGDAATIKKLNAAIDALTKAYKAADETLNGSIKELGTSMESADKALQEGQNTMQQEIDMLKSELQTLKDQLAAQKQEDNENIQNVSAVASEQETKIGSLKTLATVGACVSGVSLLGNLGLLAAFLLEKKKRFIPVR